MLNRTEKFIVYLDNETLKYLYYDYSGERSYPVMKKLYTLLHNGFVNNWLVTPLSLDSITKFIKENRIDPNYLNMMDSIGNVQFLQRFTIKTLQLIRIVNSFFGNPYPKPLWKDAFSRNPDEKYTPGFNKFSSLSATNVIQSLEREKKASQVFEFIDGYKEGKSVESLAPSHFRSLWEEFSDLIIPYLPKMGTSESHMKTFLEYDEIKDIPEFHILSNVIYPLIEAYGLEEVESGRYDTQFLAAETMSSLLPFCHFYVTTVDIAELIIMTGINEPYNVKVYDHNESSLYKLMNDITEMYKNRGKLHKGDTKTHTMFNKGLSRR